MVFDLVEARGVEPLSENPSAALSTSVDGNLKFPPSRPCRQGRAFSSFMNPTCVKAFAGWFPTLMTPATAVVGNGGRTVAVN